MLLEGEGGSWSLFQKSPRVCPRQKGVTTGVTISTNAAIYDWQICCFGLMPL